MRKFSILEESIWSDIQDRSTGDVVRKEDDVNLLDLNEFYKYIKDQYKTKVEYIDLDAMGGGNGDVLGVDITEDIILFYKPKRGHILLSWSRVKIPMPFFDELTDRFKVENPNAMRRIITEKDGSCTNKTFVDAIEFFLRHKESMMNESIWSDIQDRSAGEVTRKEDAYDIDEKELERGIDVCIRRFVIQSVYYDRYDKSPDAFYDCMKNWDENIVTRAQLYDRRHETYINPKDVIPSFIRNNWETGKNYKVKVEETISDQEEEIRKTGFTKKPGESINDTLSKWFDNHQDEIADEYSSDIEEYAEEYYREGGSHNVDIGVEEWWDHIEFITQINIYQEHKNDMNESIWSDLQDRSSGEIVRKEDEFTEKDRKDLDTLIVSYANEVIYGRGMGTEACNLDDFCDYIETDNEIKDLNKDKVLQYVKDYWADEVCEDVDGAIEQAQSEYHQDMYESIWSDIQDRSTGETIRKEDDINRMKCDELYDYIHELYEQINPFPVPLKSGEGTSDKKIQYFSIPIFKVDYKVYRLDVLFMRNKISKLTLMATDKEIEDFKRPLADNFNVFIRLDKALDIEEKDGSLTNQTCMKLISFIVENAPEPYLKKREN